MPSVVFAFGDTSKEVDLKDINSVDDVASNMKEVMTVDIISLLNSEEKEIVNNTIAEAICRAGYNLDSFDWDIKGEIIK
tara:strand:+ start:628 stop:864 length:237 start_codon:yes stop_codon:yes gene_type:complete